MRKCGGRVRVPQGADGIVAGTSHCGGDFGNQKRGHNYRIAAFLNRSEDLEALGMASLVRIERIHEHARVYGVAETSRAGSSTRTPAGSGSERHL